jgi:hypothetical protein
MVHLIDFYYTNFLRECATETCSISYGSRFAVSYCITVSRKYKRLTFSSRTSKW